MMKIAPVTETLPLAQPDPIREAASAVPTLGSETSFGDVLVHAVEQANHADAVAAQKVDGLARGVNDDLHGTMIAVKEADISVKLVGTIRNRLLDAFNELWKTSV
jgi:flagellar hook-basal body complex protein FliE